MLFTIEKFFIVLACGILARAQQTSLTYNVISLVTKQSQASMAVVVDSNVYPLIASTEYPLLYTGSAPIAQEGYYYAKVIENKVIEQEAFIRHPVTVDETPNEFYNRSWNTWDISPVPNVLEPLSVIHRIDTELHKDGQIPTLHITANQTEVDSLHTNVLEEIKVTANLTYIGLHEVQKFELAEFELSGRGSRYDPKVSYNIKLPKGSNLYGYRRVKLRSISEPSYIREYVSYKALSAAGIAVTHFSYVRLFINEVPVGLFGLIEIYKNPWLANEFADGDDEFEQGILYQGNHGSDASIRIGHYADLSYYGGNLTAYEDGQYKIKEDPSNGNITFEPLMHFTKFIHDAPSTETNAVEIWNAHLDTDSFLRCMAMEVLLGFSDGYIANANNYYLYQNLQRGGQFVYIPSDLDLTLGSTIIKLSDMISGNYSTFPAIHIRPLVTKIMQVPTFKQQFENHLRTLSEKLVTPAVLFPSIDDTVAMITQDVEWDSALPRLSQFNWTQGLELNSTMAEIMFDPALWPYPIDKETVIESFTRNSTPPFEVAVNGPTGYIFLTGVKEWIANISTATQNFFRHNH